MFSGSNSLFVFVRACLRVCARERAVPLFDLGFTSSVCEGVITHVALFFWENVHRPRGYCTDC